MIFIFGGSYQEKREYALTSYGYCEKDVFDCAGQEEIDFSKKVIDGVDRLILNQLKAGKDPLIYLKDNLSKLSDSVLLCTDISCGVVPTEPLMRAWREATGRGMAFLSANSESVIRVFCGIGTVLK